MIHLLTALGPFTIADWCALSDREDGSRLELIKGNWLVTAPPTGQHQWAESELITLLKTALRTAERTDLYALGGVGVEVTTEYRTALIPDFAVLNTPPLNTTFGPNDLLLAGEIWSPGNSNRGQRDKPTSTRMPAFRSSGAWPRIAAARSSSPPTSSTMGATSPKPPRRPVTAR